MPGVFDMKWSSVKRFDNKNNILAAGCADGSVRFVRVVDDVNLYNWENNFEEFGNCSITKGTNQQKDLYALSIDWNYSNSHIIVSQNTGKLALIQIGFAKNDKGTFAINGTVEKEWEAHTYSYSGSVSGVGAEVWTAAFQKTTDIIYSGAEDGKLKAWDNRVDKPIFVDKESHTAGVCTVSFDHHDHHRFATGCYDSCVRIWDTRLQGRGPISEPMDAGGGVWRIKWHPKNKNIISAACMRGGFRIFNISEDSSIETIDQLYDQPKEQINDASWEQLAYGIDWLPCSGTDITYPLLGASFYDRSLRIYQ